MAVFIQQGPEEVSRSFSVQRRAEIVDVLLCSASVDSHQKPGGAFQQMSISVGHHSSVESFENKQLSVNIDFELAASPEGDDSVRLFGVKCSFRVTYQLEEGYQPTPEETAAFAAANAVFNVWPYFREFAQNTCTRLGFSSAPTIPFLKLVPKPDEKPDPDVDG